MAKSLITASQSSPRRSSANATASRNRSLRNPKRSTGCPRRDRGIGSLSSLISPAPTGRAGEPAALRARSGPRSWPVLPDGGMPRRREAAADVEHQKERARDQARDEDGAPQVDHL